MPSETDSDIEASSSSVYESESDSEDDNEIFSPNTDPQFDVHDSSDEEDLRNTIGNIPVSWYDDEKHIGYDFEGRQISKPAKRTEIEEFLAKADDPNYWRTIQDKQTGKDVVLSDDILNAVSNIQSGRYPKVGYNPYQPFLDLFSHEVMKHPIVNEPDHKRSFVPSKSEAKKISKLVYAIKMGWLKPKKPEKPEDEAYDLWATEEGPKSKSDLARSKMRIPAPKMDLPGHHESYNPPPEYLFDEKEEKKWQEQEEDERKLDFLPQKHSCLRHVPQYSNFVKERFQRCMDLYLASRKRKMRLNVKAEDLLPKLPEPKDLRPFPTMLSLTYFGHTNRVTSLSVEVKGQYFASVGQDRILCIWELATGRCCRKIPLPQNIVNNDEKDDSDENSSKTGSFNVAWCPNPKLALVAVSIGSMLYLVNVGVGDKLIVAETDSMLTGLCMNLKKTVTTGNEQVAEWEKVEDNASLNGLRVQIQHLKSISQITWHPMGDYFSTVSPEAGSKAILLHQMSKQKTQVMFSKLKGTPQKVLFHPLRPTFFVVTERYIRVYNLVKQQLTKKLTSNCKQISSIAVHPKGDNMIVGSFDCRLDWFDLDLSGKPYKTFSKHHKSAVRAVAFHKTYPLFASCSTDGTIVVCHGMVYSDLMQNPLIVPLKVLRNDKTVDLTDCAFHPLQPWLLACGSDGRIRLYT